MTQKQKGTRTQISNLAEIAVELSEREMRVVSGGISINMLACVVNSSSSGSAYLSRTNIGTGNDWDSD